MGWPLVSNLDPVDRRKMQSVMATSIASGQVINAASFEKGPSARLAFARRVRLSKRSVTTKDSRTIYDFVNISPM